MFHVFNFFFSCSNQREAIGRAIAKKKKCEKQPSAPTSEHIHIHLFFPQFFY